MHAPVGVDDLGDAEVCRDRQQGDRLVAALVKDNLPSVAMMGSHSIGRDSPAFLQFARIARELHDVVAHSMSLMVVQANAGAYLAGADPDGAGA